jgi:hypothetical protein
VRDERPVVEGAAIYPGLQAYEPPGGRLERTVDPLVVRLDLREVGVHRQVEGQAVGQPQLRSSPASRVGS